MNIVNPFRNSRYRCQYLLSCFRLLMFLRNIDVPIAAAEIRMLPMYGLRLLSRGSVLGGMLSSVER